MGERQLRAGAATAVITPNLGASLCGSMTDRRAEHVHDELHARALVLDNGEVRLALVLLDLIAAGKDWLGEVKHQGNGFTGIPTGHILISCPHTHTPPTPAQILPGNPHPNYP